VTFFNVVLRSIPVKFEVAWHNNIG
jgi:hypothetical protein